MYSPFKYLRKYGRFSGLAFGLSMVSGAISSCAPTQKNSTVKECVLPSDQSGSLSGHWQQTPIQIAFHQGDFDSTEVSSILNAADEWNRFFKESMGSSILDYGDSSSPRQSTTGKPAILCPQQVQSTPTSGGVITIYKQSTWPSASKSAIALTTYCPVEASPIKIFNSAIMEVNYQDYFLDGKKKPDLTSIFAHEFGHLVGLDHSCDSNKRAGFPSCSSTSLPTAYFNAVMFPVVLFSDSGVGEQRRTLMENDQGRANCLYKDSSSLSGSGTSTSSSSSPSGT